MSYLFIERMTIAGMNGRTHPAVIGATAITGFYSFAIALLRQCGFDASEMKPIRLAFLHHDVQFLGEETGSFAPQQRRGASLINRNDYAGGGCTLSIQPTASLNLTLSLLIELDSLPDESKVTRFLHSARLCGGQVLEYRSLQLTDTLPQLKLPRSGFWILDRHDLIRDEDTDLPARFVQVLSGEAEADETPRRGWFGLSQVGYAAITPAAIRHNGRCAPSPQPHQFAEGILGLIEYRSVRRTAIPFWQAGWPEPDLFLIQQPTQNQIAKQEE